MPELEKTFDCPDERSQHGWVYCSDRVAVGRGILAFASPIARFSESQDPLDDPNRMLDLCFREGRLLARTFNLAIWRGFSPIASQRPERAGDRPLV